MEDEMKRDLIVTLADILASLGVIFGGLVLLHVLLLLVWQCCVNRAYYRHRAATLVTATRCDNGSTRGPGPGHVTLDSEPATLRSPGAHAGSKSPKDTSLGRMPSPTRARRSPSLAAPSPTSWS
eukprot:4677054-Prymnesium_polylepis.1